jgi:hypothetical protein
MNENLKDLGAARPVRAIEKDELEHLAMKYGLHPRLAKAGAVERETRDDVDEHAGRLKTGR